MTLEEVLPALREGKKIRRKAWNNDIHVELRRTKVLFFDSKERGFFDCSFSPRDIIEDDWEVME